ncbi:MAG: phosphatase [Bacteroidota bacterium]
MRTAILDCGTNTFNLLIADVLLSRWETIKLIKFPVKLQEGGFQDGNIRPAPFNRGLDALEQIKVIIQEQQVETIHATATSAIRSATNGPEFIAIAKEKYQIPLEIISGKREAELIAKGVLSTLAPEGEYLIMDIGGGSTEFIVYRDGHVAWSQSYQLGVSRLFERIKPEDPMSIANEKELMAILDEELVELRELLKAKPMDNLVGSSGSFDSIVKMIDERWGLLDANQDNQHILTSHFEVLYDELRKSSKLQRLSYPGLSPMRADFMVISMILIKYMVHHLGLNILHQSSRALKEGVLEEMTALN